MNALLLIVFRVMMFLSVALLAVGILKPEWLRFRQKQPARITIVAVAIGIFMIGAGAICHGHRVYQWHQTYSSGDCSECSGHQG
jgi:hypothetical protein